MTIKNSINTTKVGVFIGRFNPVHLGHISIIERAIKENDKVIIVIGSHKSTLNPKKLFTTSEVQEMIVAGVTDASKIVFASVRDNLYSDNEWVLSVRKQINKVINVPGEKIKSQVRLYGYTKDQTSQYLKWFPHYDTIECEPHQISDTLVHATSIRNKMYEEWLACGNIVDFIQNTKQSLTTIMGSTIVSKMYEILTRDKGERLNWVSNEYAAYKRYKESWKDAPFAPTFVTGDAVVFCNGHILLVRRKKSPGLGNYALPGGFLNADEPIRNCILRELREETKIDVPPGKVSNSLREIVVFDAPGRSQRGRTITNAGLIVLDEVKLPKVKGSDDAEKAEWVPLDVLPAIEDQFFEDHYHIITMMKGKLG